MPPQYKVAGRIYKIERDSQTLSLTLIRDQKNHHIKFAKAPPYSEFLEEGDIVAIVSEQEVILLTPQKEMVRDRSFNKQLLQDWNLYLQSLRDFFSKKDFTEIRTPALVTCPGTEPSLDVFQTELKVGSKTQKLFLPTSPELHLKKALALGADKIFEISRCFRNGEITERHQPEFMMLEWYRAYDNLHAIKQDVVDLVVAAAKALNVSAPQKIRSVSVADLFLEYCNFHLLPQTSMEDLRALAKKLNVDVHSAESIDDYFFLIFMDKIESQLPADELLFVEKYPPYQAALARLTEDGWGDRFEVYWKGYELANAFHELNDPAIQRLRSLEDLAKKQASGKPEISLDEEFFRCLECGMPPSGGIALGLERFFMALKDIRNIKELSLFPFAGS